ncbi:hypothetical protein KUH180129_p0019 (plasmid) [Staphylococcus aureus]|nr:hypothetical protein KUH180129_p0019 [Staphylococcus aureus]
MDLVNNYIYILEIPINIISKLRSLMRKREGILYMAQILFFKWQNTSY